MRTTSYKELLKEIQADRADAERALLEEKASLAAGMAAAYVRDNASKKERCVIFARRAAQKMRKSRGGWVIQTQLNYIHQAELAGIEENEQYLSESQIKRTWKRLVSLTAEILARI